MNILNSSFVLVLSTAAIVHPISETTMKNKADTNQFDCVRPVPESVVKKSVFPQSKFVLKKVDDNGQAILNGIETVLFKNGDQLKITNSGCEFVTLNFKFQISQVLKERKNTKYLYNRSILLMRSILPGIDSPINLREGIAALQSYSSKNPHPQIDTEIDYGNPEIRSVVKLVEAKQLTNKKFTVEILFYYGPL
jgi:hypothetical protein